MAAELEANSDEYTARLRDIILNGSDADSIRALQLLTDRVLGRPHSTTELTVDDARQRGEARVAAMSLEERREFALRRLGIEV
jgi:hypothetical protein